MGHPFNGAGAYEGLLDTLEILLVSLALPCVDGHATGEHVSGGMIMCGEDVVGGPGYFGVQLYEGLDEHGGLDDHVEAAGDPGNLEGLGRAVLLPVVHQARHLVLGQGELLLAPVGQGDVGDLLGDLGHVE